MEPDISPIGSSVEEAAERRAARNPTYRAQRERLRDFEEIAWFLINL